MRKEVRRKRHLSKAKDLPPQNRHKMANTQLQFLLMSVYILVTQTTNGAFGWITKFPLNIVVYEGVTNTRITFGSDTNSPSWSYWTLFPFDFPGNSGSVDLTSDRTLDPTYDDMFAIEYSQDKTATLVVFNATISPLFGESFSTAGIYYCSESSGNDYRAAHLVVIRTDPICSTSLTQSGDIVQLSCTIVYGSYRDYAIDANMTWSVNGQPIPDGNANLTINSSPTEVTASSILLVSVGGTYECKTTFNPPAEGTPGGLDGLASDLATNAPDYLKTCTISVTTTTSEVTSTTAPSTTPKKLPPCSLNIIQLLLDVILRARCYDDWLSCSYLGSLVQTCPNYCKLLHFSGGKCESPTSVDCPCIPPGIKKCNCF